MTTRIRPNRLEVNDRFPMLGFTIRTDSGTKQYEIAIGTSPDLFGPNGKSHRSRSNFYSTRAAGPLPIERGEAVYVLPVEVLARFIGQRKLYYGLATVNGGGPTRPEIDSMPESGSPYINISGLSGRSLQRVRLLPNRQRLASNYGKAGTELDWAGDLLMPGTQPATAPAAKNGPGPQGASGVSTAPAHGSYNDGYGPLPPAAAAPLPSAQTPSPMRSSSLADDSSSSGDDSLHGIDGPIPDGMDGAMSASAARYAHPMSVGPEYPQASRFEPAYSGNFRTVSGTRTVRRIVIHITDGQPKLEGTVAWFKEPKAKVSAHYIVGQDGEVVQMVRNNDIAWHASSANPDSIGIEHVARSPHEWKKTDLGLMPTEAQYCASAALVRWLCGQYNLSLDRDHILGHSEADPSTTHTDCPNGVWEWDYYMGLVTSGTCAPKEAAASALDAAQSFDEEWKDTDVLGQPDRTTCWATAGAMVVGWRDQVSLSVESVQKIFGDQTGLATNAGLSPNDRQKLGDALGLVAEPPQDYSVDGFRRMLENYGPAWVGIRTNDGWSHAVVVTGMYGDGSPDHTFVRINDPWGRIPGTPTAPGGHNPTPGTGSRYVLTYAEFTKEYEDRLTMNGNTVNIQVLHAADTGGRMIGKGTDQTYALAASGSAARRAVQPKPRSQTFADQESIEGDAEHGINGPIPDETATAQSLSLSSEYPQASRFEPADAANFRAVSQPRTINRIVIHITDGGAKINGTIGWFKNPAAKVSAHYVIGQDGEVVQMVKHNDVAWHASSANGDSIGIEHVANTRGLKPTSAQYCASAALVSWLTTQFNLPMDRTHILGHSEADPKTTHTGCPNAVWEWDPYMSMVTSGTCETQPAQGQALAMRLPPPPRLQRNVRSLAEDKQRIIDGTPIETVSGGQGNISWELDQFSGVKASSSGSPAPLQSAETIELSNWPYCEHPGGERASAWFSVDWKFSGKTPVPALGQIRITPTGNQQGTQPLHVEAHIHEGHSHGDLASLVVRFKYHFATTEGPEIEAMTELKLFSDGSIDQISKWTSLRAA